MLNIIPKRKIYLSISGSLVILSILGFFIYGLNYGIDFTGGSLIELKFKNEPLSGAVIQDALAGFDLKALTAQPLGKKGIILRSEYLDDAKHKAIIEKLKGLANPENKDELLMEEIRFESVGPSMGKELKTKAVKASFLAILFIALYIAWAFRKVSKNVPSWKYGVCAVIALFHDVMIVAGVFVFLGKYYNMSVDLPFVAALLTILGYSVNDTIVIFDRIRENLFKNSGAFEEIVNSSVNEVFVRSIHASGTTFVSLIPVYLFGGDAIKGFSLALLIGLISGTYSSIFIASPLLVEWEAKSRN